MFEIIRDIKFIIGVISTLMIILSAFRFEVIKDEPGNNESTIVNVNIDQKSLDALAKFDRNVRHLQIKGKEASKYDYMNIVPELKESLEAASKVLYELHKLNIHKLGCDKDGGKNKNKKRNFKENKNTLSYSLRIGTRIYQVSFYWPKVLRLFINDDSD